MYREQEDMQEVLLESAKLAVNSGYEQSLDDVDLEFSPEEMTLIGQLRESAAYQYNLQTYGFDRFTLRESMVADTTADVSTIERLANKLERLHQRGQINESFQVSGDVSGKVALIEGRPRVTHESLHEAMADSLAGEHDGADHGMFGVGDGGDEDEPTGDADSGTSQNSDHGDHSGTAKKGYMDEAIASYDFHSKVGLTLENLCQLDDGQLRETVENMLEGNIAEAHLVLAMVYEAKRKYSEGELPPALQKQKFAKGSDRDGDGEAGEPPIFQKKKEESSEPPKDAKNSSTPAGQEDARYKDGVKQNENAYGSSGQGSTSEDPKQDTPGTGSATVDKTQGEDGGEVAKHPDYAKVKEEDPSHTPLNKGPANAVNEEFARAAQEIAAVLAEAGIEPGHDLFEEKFQEGWSYFIAERARDVVEKKAKKKNEDNGDDDAEMDVDPNSDPEMSDDGEVPDKE